MLYDCKRISYWIDRRLTGLAGPDYAATISFGLPLEPEDSQYGKSRLMSMRKSCSPSYRARTKHPHDPGSTKYIRRSPSLGPLRKVWPRYSPHSARWSASGICQAGTKFSCSPLPSATSTSIQSPRQDSYHFAHWVKGGYRSVKGVEQFFGRVQLSRHRRGLV